MTSECPTQIHVHIVPLASEHRRAVERLIEDRRAQFQREKEAELAERKEEEQREEQRRAIIEQERQRLLQEHAAKLLGYLPKVCVLHENRGIMYSGLLIRGFLLRAPNFHSGS